MNRGLLLLCCGYGLLVAAVVFGVNTARQRVLAELATADEQASWNEWRAETQRLSREGGPMKRRPAKAAEPPLLILLRDHYGAALGSALITLTLFYWLMAFLLRGAMNSSAPTGDVATQEPRR
jgi:hypothetical protein